MIKKSKIVYVGHAAHEEISAEAPEFLEASITALINASKKDIMASAITPGSYKFTLVVERMELPVTIEDWNQSKRVIVDDTE